MYAVIVKHITKMHLMYKGFFLKPMLKCIGKEIWMRKKSEERKNSDQGTQEEPQSREEKHQKNKRGGLTGGMGKGEREIPYSIRQTFTNKSMSTTKSNKHGKEGGGSGNVIG